MHKGRFGVAALLSLAGLLFTGATAVGATFSLSGELFHATGTAVTISCNTTTGVVTFKAHGPATGPVPGSFLEKGSATFSDTGTLSGVTATFSISSHGKVLVTGSKSLTIGSGTCAKVQVNAAMTYTAKQLSTGQADSGNAQLNTSKGFFNESFGGGGG